MAGSGIWTMPTTRCCRADGARCGRSPPSSPTTRAMACRSARAWRSVRRACAPNFGAMAEIAEGGGCVTVDVRDPTRRWRQAIVELTERPERLAATARPRLAARRFPGVGRLRPRGPRPPWPQVPQPSAPCVPRGAWAASGMRAARTPWTHAAFAALARAGPDRRRPGSRPRRRPWSPRRLRRSLARAAARPHASSAGDPGDAAARVARLNATSVSASPAIERVYAHWREPRLSRRACRCGPSSCAS